MLENLEIGNISVNREKIAQNLRNQTTLID